MDRLEELREKLHIAMETGDCLEILNISKELDKEILIFMQQEGKNKFRLPG